MIAALPETRYAKADDGVHIAYQTFGDGNLDLVVIPGFISHVELMWEEPSLARFARRLGSFARVIMFDKRGTGMSDRGGTLPDIDRRMLDVEAVMNAVGSERAAFFAVSEGGPMALLFAAAHPERTRALVLWGTYARISRAPDYPLGFPPEQFHEGAAHLVAGWGTGIGLRAWAPSVGDDPGARDFWARLQRLAASPGAAMALLGSYNEIDVRPALPLIHAPTLVMHRSGDRVCPIRLGRYLADHIEGARFVELNGTDHFWWTQDPDGIVDETETFLTGSHAAAEADRVLATVLFTDIVDSTGRVLELGDQRWKAVLEEHDALAERQVRGHGGRLVKSTGDGILATFDGPTRAVRCARAIGAAASPLGIEIRAGVHTGEVEVRNDRNGGDVAGVAVHVAQRVCDHAGSGEVLTSRTVVDLVAGSGLEFDDRGEHELKGVPGAWQLFALR